MALFQPYSKARREDVPDYVQAEIADARNRAAAKMSENAIRSQNLLGGGMLYNAGMKAAGKSPISDFIGGLFDKPSYDPSQVSGVDNMPDMATEMGGPEVVDSTGVVTPYGSETGMVDPLTASMEANAGFTPTPSEMALNDQYRIDTMASDVAGTLPDGVTAVDASISGVPPVADPLTSATTATEAANVANAASTAATTAETAAALESAMAANAAAGAGAAGAGAGAGSAAAGAGSGALAALGPLGAIAALAALFG